jgi:hypothetical protein
MGFQRVGSPRKFKRDRTDGWKELRSAATEGGETAEPEHKFRERSKHVLLMKPGGKAFS